MFPKAWKTISLTERTGWIAASGLALAFFLQSLFASFHQSLTCDEPVFMVSGYTYLARNDFRLNLEAPPLLQQIVGLPLLVMGLPLPPEDDPDWQGAVVGNFGERQGAFSKKVLFHRGNDVRWIAFWSRLPILLMGTGLVLGIYAWGKALYGAGPGLVGAWIAAFSPNLLAHAGLAASDLGCAAVLFVSLWSFWWSCHGTSLKRWAVCGLLTGLAFLSKFTCLLLLPVYAAFAAWLVCFRRSEIDLRTSIRGLLLMAAVAFLVVGLGYNGSFDYSLYLKGMRRLYHNVKPGVHFYLLGQGADKPWRSYYLVSFLLKVPIPALLLLFIAGLRSFGDSRHREAQVLLLVPSSLLFAVSCFDQANLGVRRVLPVFPFLWLFAGQCAFWAKTRWRAALVAVLLGWLSIEALWIYPRPLSYLNQLAGGPSQGPYVLADSDIDWGQDLPALARWQRQHPQAGPVKLIYNGTAVPSFYGVKTTPVAWTELQDPVDGVVYAISTHGLVWLRLREIEETLPLDWLSRYTPIGRAGYSIYLYRFPESRVPPYRR